METTNGPFPMQTRYIWQAVDAHKIRLQRLTRSGNHDLRKLKQVLAMEYRKVA